MIHAKRIEIQERLLILLPLENTVNWTILIKHNLFHWSKLWRDVELQNVQIVCFKTPRDVMQVSTLSESVGLGSELIGWYSEAISVPYDHYWLICRHEETIDYVFVQTPDPFPQSFKSRTGWNIQNFWTMNTENLFNLQMFQSFPHKSKTLFFHSCPKELMRIICDCIVTLLQGKLQGIKKDNTWQNSKTKLQCSFSKEPLGSKEGTFWHPKIG